MPRIVPELTRPSLLAFLIAGLSFATLACQMAAGQNSRPTALTGVIDGVSFEGDQYYVHGWACQEGNRGSIAINIYANHPAGAKPMRITQRAPSRQGHMSWRTPPISTTNRPLTMNAMTPTAANTDSTPRCPTNY